MYLESLPVHVFRENIYTHALRYNRDAGYRERAHFPDVHPCAPHFGVEKGPHVRALRELQVPLLDYPGFLCAASKLFTETGISIMSMENHSTPIESLEFSKN